MAEFLSERGLWLPLVRTGVSSVSVSAKVIKLINERLSTEKRLAIETEFICLALNLGVSDSMKDALREAFPEINEEEWQTILNTCELERAEEEETGE